MVHVIPINMTILEAHISKHNFSCSRNLAQNIVSIVLMNCSRLINGAPFIISVVSLFETKGGKQRYLISYKRNRMLTSLIISGSAISLSLEVMLRVFKSLKTALKYSFAFYSVLDVRTFSSNETNILDNL